MAGNPYHDAAGKFCAKGTATESYEKEIAQAYSTGDTEKAATLEKEYEAMMIIADPTSDVAQKALQRDYGNLARGSKKPGAKIRKVAQKEPTKSLNVDEHKFTILASSLSEKTPAEIRAYILENNAKYNDDKVNALQADILRSFNAEDAGYAVEFGDNRIVLTKPIYAPYDIEEQDYYDEDLIDDYDLRKNPEFMFSEVKVQGYYNEDAYAESSFHVPEEFEEDVKGINDKDKYADEFKRANNPDLPDWASVPQNISVDGKRKEIQYENKYLGYGMKRQQLFVGGEAVKAPSANIGGTRLRQLRNVVENDKEIDRLSKRNTKLEEKNASTTDKIEQLSYLKNVTERQKQNLRKTLKNDLSNALDEYDKNNKSINRLSKVTQDDKDRARQEIESIENDAKSTWRDYNIKKLSTYYPHSSEKVRLEKSKEWVNSHPNLIGQDF